MNAEHRRPLYRPFSEPSTDNPAPADGRARLLAVERAPFLEPAHDDVAVPAVVPGGRRRLGPGALAGPAAGSEG
ncbi:hypothetical protein [Kitasatospora sp. NBC_00315]|uniref:hypothetical protein n=1 Tax=Kitasatospora sp. NBC_00315 TaxID=2975963 RepID=UPI00324F0D47